MIQIEFRKKYNESYLADVNIIPCQWKKIAGRFGTERTVSKFYGPRMDGCMKRLKDSCDLCSRCKPGLDFRNFTYSSLK